MRQILKLVAQLPHFKKRVALFIFSIILAEGVIVQMIPLIDREINLLIEQDQQDAVGTLLRLFLFLYGLRIVIQLLNRISYVVATFLRTQVWHHIFSIGIEKLLYQDVLYITNTSSGRRLNQVNRAASQISRLFTDAAAQFFRNITRAIGALILLVSIDWKVALGVIMAVVMYTLIQIIRFQKDKPYAEELDKIGDREISKYWEIIPQIKLPKLFNQEKFELNRIDSIQKRSIHLDMKRERLWFFSDIGEIVLIMSTILFVSFIAALDALQGDYSLSTFVLVYGLIYRVQNPFWIVTWFMWNVQDVQERAKKYLKIINADKKVLSPEEPIEIQKNNISIIFDSVSFSYPKKDEKVLNNLSLTFEQNKFSALVGKSGAGKTTIMNMIPRFFDPNDGDIRIGEVSLKDVSLIELRNLIGFVTQESQVFSGTILENMRYAKPSATEEEVVFALKEAYAWEFIKDMPKGLETKIGERGVKLSGGQRQRLAIARIFLKNPKILLLDEATNALDSESEVLVQHSLEKAMEGRTVVAIAHRLSTIMRADTIFVVDAGQVVESGSHEELVIRNGVYKKLHDIQSGNFAEQQKLMQEYELV